MFGDEVSSPRIMVGLVLSATALLVYLQAHMLWGQRAAYAAAIIFGFSTAVPLINADATSESLLLLPMTGSLLATTVGVRRRQLRWILLAGALGGAAAMTKHVGIWPLGSLGVYLLLWGWREGDSLTRRLTPAVVFSLGAAAVAALVLAPFVATGTFGEAWDALVRFNLELGGELTAGERLQRLRSTAVLFVYVLGAPILLSAAGGWRVGRGAAAPEGAVLWWVIGGIVGAMSSGYFHAHHLVQLLPAMALLSGAFLAARRERPSPSAGRVTFYGAVVAMSALALTVTIPPYLADSPDQRHEARSFRQETTDRENANAAIGAHLASRSDETDRIFVQGGATSGAPIYVYADRDPASRYFYHFSVRIAARPEAAIQTVGDLQSDPPLYIVDGTQRALITNFPERIPQAFWELLDERYEYEGRVEYADIYRLRDAEETP